jgi:CheY-like chemotaxis protein
MIYKMSNLCKNTIQIINDPQDFLKLMKDSLRLNDSGWRNTDNDNDSKFKLNYDIIFLDLKMPNVSGYELLEFINTYYKTIINNIIVISALPKEEVEESTHKYNIKGILTKPILFENLEYILQLPQSHSP